MLSLLFKHLFIILLSNDLAWKWMVLLGKCECDSHLWISDPQRMGLRSQASAAPGNLFQMEIFKAPA
jgi:hypothetical protein